MFERHRHRYEFNNTFREVSNVGLVFSGRRPMADWSNRRATRSPVQGQSQFHPELKSRPNRPHPLFRDFVAAAAALAGEQLPLDDYALREEAAA